MQKSRFLGTYRPRHLQKSRFRGLLASGILNPASARVPFSGDFCGVIGNNIPYTSDRKCPQPGLPVTETRNVSVPNISLGGATGNRNSEHFRSEYTPKRGDRSHKFVAQSVRICPDAGQPATQIRKTADPNIPLDGQPAAQVRNTSDQNMALSGATCNLNSEHLRSESVPKRGYR